VSQEKRGPPQDRSKGGREGGREERQVRRTLTPLLETAISTVEPCTVMALDSFTTSEAGTRPGREEREGKCSGRNGTTVNRERFLEDGRDKNKRGENKG